MRQTKIVCTLGPASSSEDRLEAMIRAGMNVARLNFSHGTHDEHAATVATLRRVATRLGQPIAILQDLCGPKLRTGAMESGKPVRLDAGAHVTLTSTLQPGNARTIPVLYADLAADVHTGDRIYLSDGAIQLRVLATDSEDVTCEVVTGGTLGEHQGINLPGVQISSPALTPKDRDDLRFGLQLGVDYIALSFVRLASDVLGARDAIAEARAIGTPHRAAGGDVKVPIVAKIEKPEAVEHLDAIMEVADGIMVARGDLGVELPLASIPVLQKHIIARAKSHGLPVITATQMLESMIHAARPTRAEASDVANAILDGSDAVMLSGETAIGDFPVEAVATMDSIALATEGKWPSHVPDDSAMHRYPQGSRAVSKAALTLVASGDARAVVVFTRTGASAHFMSRERPEVPIFAFTDSDEVMRQLMLWWGVSPRRRQLSGPSETLIEWAANLLRAEGSVRDGDNVVVVGGMPIVGKAPTNFVKLHTIS